MGRNQPCQCGSGKKYKKCCGTPPTTPQKRKIEFTDVSKEYIIDSLYNKEIEASNSFDEKYNKEIEEISYEYAKILDLLKKHLVTIDINNLNVFDECFVLIQNATATFISALSCFRNGYLLQPGILLRNVIESISMATYLYKHPEFLEDYRINKIKSSKTIGDVKKHFPGINLLYGHFSKEHTLQAQNVHSHGRRTRGVPYYCT